MLRKRAIRALLVEEVAGLRLAASGDEGSEDEGVSPAAASAEGAEWAASVERTREVEHEALERAERKALLMVGLDWLALVALFLLRDTAAPFLPVGATIETVFTLGVVAVAIHSGFRLGQLEKYRAVRRAWDDLID